MKKKLYWTIRTPQIVYRIFSGSVFCWADATEISSSCPLLATLRATRPCCPKRRCTWSRWRSTRGIMMGSGTCWEPHSSSPRPPSYPRLLTPARWGSHYNVRGFVVILWHNSVTIQNCFQYFSLKVSSMMFWNIYSFFSGYFDKLCLLIKYLLYWCILLCTFTILNVLSWK